MLPQAIRNPRRSREEWRQLLRQFDQSKLSAVTFCSRQNISYQSFLKWRSLLRHENTPPTFIDITPTTSQEDIPDSTDWIVELAIGPQMILRIRPPQ